MLGPLFFSIYINDLINSRNIFNYLMYADDTTLYFNLEDVDSVNMNDNILTPERPGIEILIKNIFGDLFVTIYI